MGSEYERGFREAARLAVTEIHERAQQRSGVETEVLNSMAKHVGDVLAKRRVTLATRNDERR